MSDKGTKYEKVDQKKQVDGPKQHSGHLFGPKHTKMGASRAFSVIFDPKVVERTGLMSTLGSLWDHFGLTLGSLWLMRATLGHFGITLGLLWNDFGDYFGITFDI